MRAGTGRAAIGVDGKHVGGAAEGADGYPAAVLAETHVLDLDRDRTSTERGQRSEVMGQWEDEDHLLLPCQQKAA